MNITHGYPRLLTITSVFYLRIVMTPEAITPAPNVHGQDLVWAVVTFSSESKLYFSLGMLHETV